MPDLRKYRAKRDAAGTPEPFGDDRPAPPLPAAAARRFVVQQHAARSLHWDLRLEIDGVLVSWAVPRGPSLDPAERRLAVRTEDHPLEYQDFEGIIPEGNYGAGAMIVWDFGRYHGADEQHPRDGLAAGKLDLVLDGHKLRGRFALVRTRGAEGAPAGRSWLLLHKTRRPFARPDVVERAPGSVFSGLPVERLPERSAIASELAGRAARHGRPWRASETARWRPMLASVASEPFADAGWWFELKHDGMRLLAERSGGQVTLRSRSGRDVTAGYPEIAHALDHLPAESFAIDGELVAPDEHGHGRFERLQQRIHATDQRAVARARIDWPVTLYAFDLLALGASDLRDAPLRERRALLADLVPRVGLVRLSDHVEGEGPALFELARQHGLEGVVAKRADSPYRTGRRVETWRKIKVPREARLLIAGAAPGRGHRKALGSLVLAWHDADGVLRYAGHVGSGLRGADLERIEGWLAEDAVDAPAFEGAPERWPAGVRFATPRHGVRVRFTEVTSGGQLRHPVLLGLEPHVDPAACRAPLDAEAAADVDPPDLRAPAPELAITRRDKVFWPEEGFTKGHLLDYYEAVWPWIAPYLRDRPVVLTRYPDGIEGKSFFQKNAPDWTPDWATHLDIEGTDYFLCNDLRTLLHVVNSGAIPLHVWSARVGDLERPDWLVLDLDPKAAPFEDVVRIARHVHRLLEELATPSYVKTSGQAGLHVLVPLGGGLDHDGARTLGEILARVVCAELPELATVARPVASRGDRVYVDYLQNGRGKLIAAPFSARPVPGAPVSTPLRWSQVTRRLDPRRWNLRSTPRAMARDGDPLVDVLGGACEVGRLLDALGDRHVSDPEN